MLSEVAQIICEFADADPEEITCETELRTDLGLNSFDLVNIAVEIEKKYKVKVMDGKIASLKTVGDILKLLK